MPGEKIGEGVWAEVFGWAPGRVVKLFRPGVTRVTAWWEARMTRAAFAAGAPAPEVFEEVEVDGRFGVVLERLDGPVLLDLSRRGMAPAEVGAVLAGLAHGVHLLAAPPEMVGLGERMEGALRGAARPLPAAVAEGVRARIAALPAGGGLCHGDLHPGNVIMAPGGPRLVDWGGATRAAGWLDLATCQVINAEIAAATVADPARPVANNAATQAAYARLAGVTEEAAAAAVVPYLLVNRLFFLLGPGGSAEVRAAMRQRVMEEAGTPGG